MNFYDYLDHMQDKGEVTDEEYRLIQDFIKDDAKKGNYKHWNSSPDVRFDYYIKRVREYLKKNKEEHANSDIEFPNYESPHKNLRRTDSKKSSDNDDWETY